jgi:GNAT superfamily N-acetyltransferase
MPAMLDDPTAPVIYRTSGDVPYPPPGGPLPVGIAPCQVILRDRVTTATIIPFSAPNQVPLTLLAYLCDQLGREIEKGDTYPMVEPLTLEAFGPYWFGVFGAIMLLGEIQDGRELHEMARRGCDWERECLGSFYIKPNYPGRSSHVCNGGFLVTDASRNRGVGRLMGETYLDWAPKLVRIAKEGRIACANMLRDTHTPSSTSSTKPTSRPVAYGTPSASSGSAASRVAAT